MDYEFLPGEIAIFNKDQGCWCDRVEGEVEIIEKITDTLYLCRSLYEIPSDEIMYLCECRPHERRIHRDFLTPVGRLPDEPPSLEELL